MMNSLATSVLICSKDQTLEAVLSKIIVCLKY